MIALSRTISLPWCVLGDFNSTLNINEVKGGREHWTPDMQNFRDCLVSAALGHVKTMGKLFTWTNKRPESLIQKCLDRVLANQAWFFQYAGGFSLVKHSGLMDHCPLLLIVPMQLEKFNKSL